MMASIHCIIMIMMLRVSLEGDAGIMMMPVTDWYRLQDGHDALVMVVARGRRCPLRDCTVVRVEIFSPCSDKSFLPVALRVVV
jgi:hypothetical protein